MDDERLDPAGAESEQPSQAPVERQARGPFGWQGRWNDLHGVRRAAGDEWLPGPVEDLTARRGDRQVPHAVGVRLLDVLFA